MWNWLRRIWMFMQFRPTKALDYTGLPVGGGGRQTDISGLMPLAGGTFTGAVTYADDVPIKWGSGGADQQAEWDTVEGTDMFKMGYPAGAPGLVALENALVSVNYFGASPPPTGAIVTVKDGAGSLDEEYAYFAVDAAGTGFADFVSLATIIQRFYAPNADQTFTDQTAKWLDTGAGRVKIFRKIDMGHNPVGSVLWMGITTTIAASPGNDTMWKKTADNKWYITDSGGVDHALW